MSWPALPVFMTVAGWPVILLGEGETADAKRRLLERAGAEVVGEAADARLAIVAIADEAEALAAVGRLRARGVLVNAVDRPELCDFTLPAIVDRAPVLVAIGTGGVSAGLAAALRQRLETILPAGLGRLAEALYAAKGELRERYPDANSRRRTIAAALADGGPLDPVREYEDPAKTVRTELVEAHAPGTPFDRLRAEGEVAFALTSPDPDDLTIRQARALARADRVVHMSDVPATILDRARADAARIVSGPDPLPPVNGLTVRIEMARDRR